MRGSVISGEAGIQGDITRATGADRREGVYVNLNNGWMERRKSICDENRAEGKDGIVERKDQEAPGARVYTPPVIYVTCESRPAHTHYRPPLSHGRACSTGVCVCVLKNDFYLVVAVIIPFIHPLMKGLNDQFQLW